MSEEELKQMSGDELIGIIKAQRFEIKEIDRLNNLNKQLVEECQRLDDEETRLNNILDELEKVIQENKFWIYNDVLETRENFEVIDVEYILDKLKALKENNK